MIYRIKDPWIPTDRKKKKKEERVLHRKMPVDKYGRNDKIRKTILWFPV